MSKNIKQIGKSKIYDVCTFNHKGYLYDMPIVRESLSDYTTNIRTPFVFNIANSKID